MTDTPKTPAPPEPHDYKPCDSECNNKGCHHVQGHGDPCGLPATAFVHALVQPSPPSEEPAPTCPACGHVHKGQYCEFNMRSHGSHLCLCSVKAQPPPAADPTMHESDGCLDCLHQERDGLAILLRDAEEARRLAEYDVRCYEQASRDDKQTVDLLEARASRADAEVERLQGELARLWEALKLTYKVMRPWIDGGITYSDWEAAFDALTRLAALREIAQEAVTNWSRYGGPTWPTMKKLESALAPQEGAEKK